MPIEFVGGHKSIPATKSRDIHLEYSRDGEIREILVNSTGRARITALEQEAVESYITGIMELDQLKKEGNVYTLPEPIPYQAGMKMTVSLTNLYDGTNEVYVCFVISYTE